MDRNKRKVIIALISCILLLAFFAIIGILAYTRIKHSIEIQDYIAPSITDNAFEYEVKFDDTQKSQEQTATPKPTQPVYPLSGWVKADIVNIRKSPTQQSKALTKVQNSQEITLIDKIKDQDDSYFWYKIEHEQIIGYIREDFIVLEKPSFAESISYGMYIKDVVDGEHKYSRLVYVKDIAPDVLINLTLAYDDNFIGPKLYTKETAMIQYSTGLMLNEVSKTLIEQGYQIMLWDGYRPYTASVKMFEIIKDPNLVADPKRGSNHNRGAAVDVTLYKDGKQVDMPTDFRHLNVAHAAISSDMSVEERKNYEILADAMTGAGFTTYKNEWWHFNDPDCADYPVMDFSLGMF